MLGVSATKEVNLLVGLSWGRGGVAGPRVGTWAGFGVGLNNRGGRAMPTVNIF